MNIYIGADHRGFALKSLLAAELKDEGYAVTDVGAVTLVEGDDYVDFARAVAKGVAQDAANRRGIVICGSGFGVDITANKVSGIRAALAMSPDHISQGRHDDDVNVLALAADFVTEEDAKKIMKVFLVTPAAKNDRYLRRQEEIREIEAENNASA